MKINLFLFILFFPVLLLSQSLRDSKQKFITLSKESIINNEANLFTFSLDFKHETPFHCASVAWTENHEGEKPNSHFLFSFSFIFHSTIMFKKQPQAIILQIGFICF